jgi:hypothetical protein
MVVLVGRVRTWAVARVPPGPPTLDAAAELADLGYGAR